MVLDDLVERTRAMRKERAERLRNIRTRAQAEKYRDEVRRKLKKCFGPLPGKTPLNARITGVRDERHFTIENVTFESRPGFVVTANLYLPKTREGKIPGVVGSCGHAGDGKSCPNYQAFCRELARNGFAVLIFDPFSQGERDQYYRLRNRGVKLPPVLAHNMMGKQLELLGESFGAWRVWDGIRALDYLRSRPEVDPARIGLTGNSGGGTMTSWIWGVEPRFCMAAPSCFVTTFLANLENELPQDNEQYPPGLLGGGMDMGDLFMARAPDPVILIGQRYCFFDWRGLQETYEEVRKFYGHFGARDRVRLFIGKNPHGYFPDGRLAMVDFFRETMKFKGPGHRKPVPGIERELLDVTPKGQVLAMGSRPIYEWISDRAGQLAEARKKLSKAETAKRLSRLLNAAPPKAAPHFRVLRPQVIGDDTYGRYAVETERNIRGILRGRLKSGNAVEGFSLEPAKEVVLYVPHLSSEQDLAAGLEGRTKLPLYALDPRGMGESMPDDWLDFWHAYGNDYMAHGFGVMFGESYLGDRVRDVLAAVKLLREQGAARVQLWGRGQGALLALFAAVLDPATPRVRLINGPVSCMEWASEPVVDWPSANFVRGLLHELDLPDCYRALGGKVKLVQPWDHRMKPYSRARARAALGEAGLSARLLA